MAAAKLIPSLHHIKEQVVHLDFKLKLYQRTSQILLCNEAISNAKTYTFDFISSKGIKWRLNEIFQVMGLQENLNLINAFQILFQNQLQICKAHIMKLYRMPFLKNPENICTTISKHLMHKTNMLQSGWLKEVNSSCKKRQICLLCLTILKHKIQSALCKTLNFYDSWTKVIRITRQ